MTMPPLARRPEDSRGHFARLAELAADHDLARLSMGTTQDYEVAAQEGATIVRLEACSTKPVRARKSPIAFESRALPGERRLALALHQQLGVRQPARVLAPPPAGIASASSREPTNRVGTCRPSSRSRPSQAVEKGTIRTAAATALECA